jgi:hypothetical protein
LGEGKTGQLVDLDPEGKFINSTRVRCGRSLQGYPFNPCLTKENYLDMQNKVKAVFDQLKDGLFFNFKNQVKKSLKEMKNVSRPRVGRNLLSTGGHDQGGAEPTDRGPLSLQGGRPFPATCECVPLLAIRTWHLSQRSEGLRKKI